MARGDGSVLWRLWAPRAEGVELILVGADGAKRGVEMTRENDAHFVHRESAVDEGQRYLFRRRGGEPRPDPASRWQQGGVHAASAVFFPQRHAWRDAAWRGRARSELVFYELHVGTFTREGTFDAVIPRLSTLAELGVTALELLPVAQFPGSRGWGYDGVYPYAAQENYGGPRALQRLVDACHAAGLAVFIDAVYNHFGPEGAYLGEFAPYQTGQHHTPWGSAVNYDDAGCEGVRSFVVENARWWIRDFHCDGLRLDAIHAIHDEGARHILADVARVVHEEGERRGSITHAVAESSLNDVRLLDPEERNGFGLNAQWSDDFHHCVHAELTGERRGYYADFSEPADLVKALARDFVYDGRYSVHRERRVGAPTRGHRGDEMVISIQNHDQVGNRAAGDRFGTLLDAPARRLAASLLLLAPNLPLLFMGEEYGEENPFPFFCSFADPSLVEGVRKGRREEFKSFGWEDEVPDPQAPETMASAVLSWSWPEGSQRAGLRRLYADLLRARREWPALRDFEHRAASLAGSADAPVVVLERGEAPSRLVAVFNLRAVEAPLPEAVAARAELASFSSEWMRYGGARAEDDRRPILLPREARVFGAEP